MEHQEASSPLDQERLKKCLSPERLGKLATLHGLDLETAREQVQQWPLGTRMAMELVGLIEQSDTGEYHFAVTLTPDFERAVNLVVDQGNTTESQS